MKCDKQTMLLYAVTDRAWVGKMTLYEQVEAALKNGATCVQLREKELDEEHFLAEAKELCALCRAYHVPFIVNDNVDIALACGADGVHVGQEDMAARAFPPTRWRKPCLHSKTARITWVSARRSPLPLRTMRA